MHFTDVKGILSASNGMNLYRGCQHGCIYCDSRSLCYRMDHDFEDIEVKRNALELLEDALVHKRKKCVIGTGSMCDPYMPLEETLRMTRGSLEIIDRHGFGLAILTKSARILRDLDLLLQIRKHSTCIVQMTLTTFDESLCRILEPAVSTTRERAEALGTLRDNGIPTVVWLGPILPFINDTEENLRGLLGYCVETGVSSIICFGMGLTLRDGNREYFYRKLDEHFPGLRPVYEQKYGNSYSVMSDSSDRLMDIFRSECDRHGIRYGNDELFRTLQTYEEREPPRQLSFFT